MLVQTGGVPYHTALEAIKEVVSDATRQGLGSVKDYIMCGFEIMCSTPAHHEHHGIKFDMKKKKCTGHTYVGAH